MIKFCILVQNFKNRFHLQENKNDGNWQLYIKATTTGILRIENKGNHELLTEKWLQFVNKSRNHFGTNESSFVILQTNQTYS